MLRRLGIPWILLVALGVAASGAWAAGAWTSDGLVPAGGVRIAGVGVIVALLLVARRLLHELRDIARDQIAYPERPLATGQVRPETLWRWVRGLAGATFVGALGFVMAGPVGSGAVGAGALGSGAVGSGAAPSLGAGVPGPWPLVALLICGGLLWFSLHEFFLGETLPEQPALRASAHSLVALPIVALSISVFSPEAILSNKGLGYALLLYGSTVMLALSRALDPKPHPTGPTVASTQGAMGAFVVLLAVSAATAWGARLAAAARVLGIFEWALVVLCAVALAKPDLRRFTGAFGVISFLAHAWAGPLVLLLRWLTRR